MASKGVQMDLRQSFSPDAVILLLNGGSPSLRVRQKHFRSRLAAADSENDAEVQAAESGSPVKLNRSDAHGRPRTKPMEECWEASW